MLIFDFISFDLFILFDLFSKTDLILIIVEKYFILFFLILEIFIRLMN